MSPLLRSMSGLLAATLGQGQTRHRNMHPPGPQGYLLADNKCPVMVRGDINPLFIDVIVTSTYSCGLGMKNCFSNVVGQMVHPPPKYMLSYLEQGSF